MFALYYSAKRHRLYGINASGWSPKTWTPEYFKKLGYDQSTGMPRDGANTVNVPGAVDGWSQLLDRFGNFGFRRDLEAAAETAQQGFGVTERIHKQWQDDVEKLKKDPDSRKTFLVHGHAPELYSNFRNPEMAHAFRVLQRRGRDAYYNGPIGRAIVKKIRRSGGSMSMSDLRNFKAEWVKPISTKYHGYDVYEMPPNSQGFATLEMLNILDVCVPKLGYKLSDLGPRSSEFWHLLASAKVLAYDDLNRYNGDPRFSHIPVKWLTSKHHASKLCAQIDPDHAIEPRIKIGKKSGTIYLTAADRWGNMVSFIYSNYAGFGSGLTVPGYGFPLQNRAALFSLDPSSPNVVAPRKRPFHTLIPAFIMKNGKPLVSFGNMGGDEQPQAQATEVVNMVDLGMNMQAAGDAARFHHSQSSGELSLESNLYDLVGPDLAKMGWDVQRSSGAPMGGYQAIYFKPIPGTHPPRARSIRGDPPVNGVYRAGSDMRKDGSAAGW